MRGFGAPILRDAIDGGGGVGHLCYWELDLSFVASVPSEERHTVFANVLCAASVRAMTLIGMDVAAARPRAIDMAVGLRVGVRA